MASTETYVEAVRTAPTHKSESNGSGISWAAVIAGAVVAAALAVTLLALGTGLGLTAVSPWWNSGLSAPALGAAAIIWMIAIQIMASAMGGYLAGRLRTKWTNVHTEEVFFRDTAHGFLVWALAVVMTASFLAAASARMVGDSAQIAAANRADARTGPGGYYIDALFRSDHPVTDQNSNAAARAEAENIFAHAFHQKQLPPEDRSYLAQLVSARTGIQLAGAQQRVDDVFTQAQQAADAARKAAAHFLLWMFIALLIGAFCASYAATMGGRQRDNVRVV